MVSLGDLVDEGLGNRSWSIVAVVILSFVGWYCAVLFPYSTPLEFITLLVPVLTWGLGNAYGKRQVYKKVAQARSGE